MKILVSIFVVYLGLMIVFLLLHEIASSKHCPRKFALWWNEHVCMIIDPEDINF